MRPDGIDDNAPLQVIAANEWQQRADAHVMTIHDRKTDQQDADQRPPDYFQGEVIKHGEAPSDERREHNGLYRGCQALGGRT